MEVNDNADSLMPRGDLRFFASRARSYRKQSCKKARMA